MEIRFHEKLYSDSLSGRKLALIRKKIKKKSFQLELYLITLPIGKEGILEVYWYPELLQTFYQEMDTEIIVVGLADSREKAFELIKKIVTDIGCENGQISSSRFFEECK